MKRHCFKLLVLPVLIFSLIFCSCSSKKGVSSDGTGASVSGKDSSSVKLVFVEYDNGYQENEIRESFISDMRLLGYDEVKMKFDVKNAQKNSEKLNEYVNSLKGSDYDLIVAIADQAAQAVCNAKLDIPCVFIAATDPVGDLLVTNPDKPDKNLTGTVMDTSPSKIISLIRIFTPEVKKTGVLIYKGNKTAQKSASLFEKESKSEGLTAKIYTVESLNDIQNTLKKILSENDTVFIPADNQLDSVMGSLVKTAQEQKKYIYSSGVSAVNSGALASYCSSVDKLSQNSAAIADQIIKGTSVSDIPVDFSAEGNFYLSSKTYSAFGIGVPEIEGLIVV